MLFWGFSSYVIALFHVSPQEVSSLKALIYICAPVKSLILHVTIIAKYGESSGMRQEMRNLFPTEPVTHVQHTYISAVLTN